jgi:peptide/nickel transport system ATP-binding protein
MYAGRIVEGGDSESVTQQPAHPYTRLLINSAPDPDRIASHANGSALNGSAQNGSALNGSASPADEPSVDEGTGEVASLIHPPSGCRFHPRCPHAMDVCTVQVPPRFTVGGPASQSTEPAGSADSANPTHWAACWLYSPEHADGGTHTNGEAGAAA